MDRLSGLFYAGTLEDVFLSSFVPCSLFQVRSCWALRHDARVFKVQAKLCRAHSSKFNAWHIEP